ncbi:hypothetical protein [Streptomyces noursei]|uniref:hypothetical protein n=1 Tax=Streptomyces noursei TaxID=1971 RepID=UPI00167AFD4B|nr:hypothetical protein [Streptomyces noursei]MCZ1018943.1 hypothetical protein [Streptomyces noursei]GGX22932.1 hypothetical protein GCM10010341_50340 [Streptomyces noursei]
MTPVPRAAMVLAALSGLPDGRFEETLRTYRSVLADRAGRQAHVLAGVALPGVDSDEEQYGHIAPLDGFVQLTLPGGTPEDLVTALRGAAGELAGAVDVTRSVLVAGEGHLVQPYDGKHVYAMLARREAAVTEEELTAWWIKHGEIAVTALASHFGYEQLHGRDALTERVGASAGFTNNPSGLFETMSADDIEALTGSFDQQTAERALADERGYLDRTEMRGQWTSVIGRPPRPSLRDAGTAVPGAGSDPA